jgi:hypothetical protein
MNDQDHRFHVAFPITDDIRGRALSAIKLIRTSDDKQKDSTVFVDAVEEISSQGLQFFFLNPIKAAGLGPFAYKTVQVTLNAAQKAVMAVARKLAKSMDDEQIISIAGFVESVIYDFEIEEE